MFRTRVVFDLYYHVEEEWLRECIDRLSFIDTRNAHHREAGPAHGLNGQPEIFFAVAQVRPETDVSGRMVQVSGFKFQVSSFKFQGSSLPDYHPSVPVIHRSTLTARYVTLRLSYQYSSGA